jgi:type VI secretion system secreted protein VgrG
MSHDSRKGFEVVPFCRLDDPARPDVGYFYEWSTTKQTTSGTVTLNDFDFTKSRASLAVERREKKDYAHADSEIYDFPGGYSEWHPGEECANVCIQAAQANYEVVRGLTTSLGLSTGALFCLDGYDACKDQNRQYLAVAAHYEFDSGSFRSDGGASPFASVALTAIPSQVQFRPARKTPAPFVPGPQSARVVGPKGAVFCTDPWARVKIQFAWDRYGKFDENSSCFVRVSQGWAGSKFGALHLPRIGQEVIVEFLDGDIDRPIVTGRVYNDFNKPFYDPQTQASRSGFKTQTVGGPSDHYNELRFDDQKGAEEILMRAQRNFTTHVLHDKSTTIDNNHTHSVRKDMHVTVSEGDYATEVKTGRMTVHVPKADVEVAAQTITLDVGAAGISITQDAIVISFGAGNSIKLSPAGIEIQGKPVRINC